MLDGAPEIDHGPKLSEFERCVLENFFWSFRHSQGNTALHETIFRYLTYSLNPDGTVDLQSLQRRVFPHVQTLRIPVAHVRQVPVDEDGKYDTKEEHRVAQSINTGFTDMWNKFIEELQRRSTQPPSQDIKLMTVLLDHMLRQDDKYYYNHRPSLDKASSKKVSFVQKYIYEQEPAQTPELTQMYTDLRNFIHSNVEGSIARSMEGASNEELATLANLERQLLKVRGRFLSKGSPPRVR
jgi:hypothetical protein